jgi:hypothetical protein
MTKTYQIHGAGCKNCLKTISSRVSQLSEVKKILNIDINSIVIIFDNSIEYINIDNLNSAFYSSKYWLSQMPHNINFVLVPDPARLNVLSLYVDPIL